MFFRIHLFTLLFEECKLMCATIVDDVGVVFNMIRLLSFACKTLQRQTEGEGTATTPPSVTPKWMTPMLLFIDLHEKVVLGTKRRAALSKVIFTVYDQKLVVRKLDVQVSILESKPSKID